MNDLDRLKIAFDLLWVQFNGVSEQLKAEREKNASLIKQMGANPQRGLTDDGAVEQVVRISR